MVILAGLHAVSRDFSDEFPCSGIRLIHKISAKLFDKESNIDAILCLSHTVEC